MHNAAFENCDQIQNGSIEVVYTSFVEVRANDLIHDFIRIELVKSNILFSGKRYNNNIEIDSPALL